MRVKSLWLLIFLFAGNYSFSQQITINQKNIPLSKVFDIIQQQSGFSLLYDYNLVRNERNIDINIRNVSLEEALNTCLKNLPLTFVITDKIIVIKPRVTERATDPDNFVSIHGMIVDGLGHALPGASVSIRELGKGTQTNTGGYYILEKIVPGVYTIDVSFIGFEPVARQLTINDQDKEVLFRLKATDNQLEDVVITALGITRSARSLSYATQVVSGKELNTVRSTNVLNSLNGKVSGVQINRTSGGPGGSVRVVLRGDKSTRNSQPLYVIDGLPIINPTGGPNVGLYNYEPDAGDILSTISPDDIESINVLKGASASALYGSQGSNGVILITTKKGRLGKEKVDISNSTSFEQPLMLPQLQFHYNQATPQTVTSPGTENSWGARNAGNVDGSYVKDFFQTGVTSFTNVSLSSGNDRSANYLSYTNTANKGILPTSTFSQHTLSFRQSSKLLHNKLTFEATVLGSVQNVHNRLTPGIYFNPLTGLYMLPRGLDFNSYRQYEYFSPIRYLSAQNWWNIHYDKDQANGGGWGGQDYQQNPYWILNRNPIDNRNLNIYASATLQYELNNKMNLQARGNINGFFNDHKRSLYATTQASLARFNGSMRSVASNNSTTYGDLLISGEGGLGENWSLQYTAGTSILNQRGKMLIVLGSPTVPNVFMESALDRATIDIRNFDGEGNNPASKQTQSLFATAQFAYRNSFFLEVADRNDWSSTLAFTPSERKGYNYYSVGASAIISDLLHMPAFVNFAKLRLSYAVVGNDIAAFSTYPLYTFSSGGQATLPGSSPVNVPGLGLKPEKNRSLEMGTQWVLLQNRLTADITWYKSNIVNQYFKSISVPPGLGVGGLADINAGNIQNSGLELAASYKLIAGKTFDWTATLNFSHNSNRIKELFGSSVAANPSPGQMYRLRGGSGGSDGILIKGGSYGDIYGRAFKRDGDGRIVVNAVTALPYLVDDVFLGNPNPRYFAGWKNQFTVRNFGIAFLIDGRFGGRVQSITSGYLDQMGVSKSTADVRDGGGTVNIPNAVDETNKPWTGSTDAETYYRYIGGKTPVGEAYMYSATAIRLREFAITWRKQLGKSGLKTVQLSLIGSNLFFIKRYAPFDPELVAGVNPGGVGVDVFGLPAYRSIGFSINAGF